MRSIHSTITRWGLVALCAALTAPAGVARAQTPTPGPTASGSLQRITLAPLAATREVGQTVNYTATGHFTVGTKNLTQQVVYSSSDSAVAVAPNTEGNRSRVEAVGPGTARISAEDPETSISTTDSGNDATLTVLGPLERISLAPVAATRAVGQVQNYTATGHFAGGLTRNLTQQVIYSSSDTSVAVAPNTEGNRSRVEAVGPGTARISAEDPETSISTTDSGNDATLTVLGPLERISLAPVAATRAVGQVQNYTATGHFAGGQMRNVTQQVIYSSSDTSVAVAPNTEGNRSRVEAVGPGTARISAEDPETSISTTDSDDDAILTVVEPGAVPTGPTPTPSPLCGDADGNGSVSLTDGVNVLRAAAALASNCSLALCDTDGSGEITVSDGVAVLRVAAGLQDDLACGGAAGSAR